MENILPLLEGSLIGLILGLLGGGGALIAIPVLIYLLHYSFRAAIGSSLALVMVGAIPAILLYWKKRQIDFIAAALMGLGGAAGSSLASRFSAHAPKEALLGLLIVLMALSAWNILKPKKREDENGTGQPEQKTRHHGKLLLAGFGIGILTGLVGVGGGFLLVPVLLMFGNCTPRTAIATSLLIIGVNAAFGAAGFLAIIPLHTASFRWLMTGSLLGSVAGFLAGSRMSDQQLKQGFGLLLIGLIILMLLFPPAS